MDDKISWAVKWTHSTRFPFFMAVHNDLPSLGLPRGENRPGMLLGSAGWLPLSWISQDTMKCMTFRSLKDFLHWAHLAKWVTHLPHKNWSFILGFFFFHLLNTNETPVMHCVSHRASMDVRLARPSQPLSNSQSSEGDNYTGNGDCTTC